MSAMPASLSGRGRLLPSFSPPRGPPPPSLIRSGVTFHFRCRRSIDGDNQDDGRTDGRTEGAEVHRLREEEEGKRRRRGEGRKEEGTKSIVIRNALR